MGVVISCFRAYQLRLHGRRSHDYALISLSRARERGRRKKVFSPPLGVTKKNKRNAPLLLPLRRETFLWCFATRSSVLLTHVRAVSKLRAQDLL